MSEVVTHAAHPERRAKTKIVATVGPASDSEHMLEELIRAGANVFRINMAHGSPKEKEGVIARIRQVADRLRHVVGILADLGGPKIRLTVLPNGAIECKEGELYRFVRGEESTETDLAVTYERLIDELDIGDRVLLSDGTVGMTVVEKHADHVVAKVVQSGTIRSRQGVNLPGVKLSVHALTDVDREHAEWACRQGINFIGMSFVRNADEIRELRQLLAAVRVPGRPPRIIAKIEKGEALENLIDIVQTADGVMVARGDLGVEIDVARLAVEQKRVISVCNLYQKPVIVATQMLDSMTHSSQPTRAEATDVANAILDGTDACMLSGETAVGERPPEVVRMMNRIALATEPLLKERRRPKPENRPENLEEITQYVVHNSVNLAEQLTCRLMVVASHSGATALAIAKERPLVPVVGVSDSRSSLESMALLWGITPMAGIPTSDTGELLVALDRWARDTAGVTPGMRMVLVTGTHWTDRGHNMVLVHEVGHAS